MGSSHSNTPSLHYSVPLSPMSVIEVQGLTRKFKTSKKQPGLKGAFKALFHRQTEEVTAVKEVSFAIEEGELVGFLGPNGAGKSTTVKIITGMLRPNDGRVLFEGHDIRNDMVAFRALLGYVPEEAYLYSYLSGLEYL